MIDLVLSLMMIAIVALAAGAVFLYRRGDTKRASLMAILAFVMLANVAIWTVPTASGDAPRDLAVEAE